MLKGNSENKVLNAWNEFRLERKCSQLPHKALFIFSYEGSLPQYPSLAKTWRSLGQFPITAAASQLITIVVNTLTLESDKMPRCQPVCRMQPQQWESSKHPCALWLKLGSLGRLPGQHQEWSQGNGVPEPAGGHGQQQLGKQIGISSS